MEEADLDQVLEIERACFPTPWSRESFLHEIRGNPCARNLVVREEDRVLAYACVWIVAGELKINNIATHAGWRRRGLGTSLLRFVLRLARAQGCFEAQLEVRPSNEPARTLYERHGFREIGRRKGYYPDTGEDAILMAAHLREEVAPQ